MDRKSRIERVLVGFAARNPSEDHSDMGPLELDQMQVSALCISHGLAVVPSHGTKNSRCTCPDPNCKHPGRHPRTPNGLDDATDDPELVRGFWIEWPKAKVIIATGQQGIIAVTARGVKGDRALAALVDNDEASSETIEFRDRHKRHTYLLRAPEDAIPKGRVTLAEGVVVHGRGSFIVVPRNVTLPGRYRQLFEREIAPAPNWLLKLLGSEPIVEPTSPEQLPSSEPKPAERPMIPERTFSESLTFELFPLHLDWIIVPDGTSRCDDDKVRALAETYLTDVRGGPLAVRPLIAERTRESDPVFSLLSDPHQLAALKRLGIERAQCLVIKGGETVERLWKLAELIHQPETKVLDWAHGVMERLVREKGGQVAHPRGGTQPHDKGFAAAQRVLGVSRRDLARAALIAKITVEAQEEIRRAKLDDIQRALLEIANAPPEEQVEKARELKERYSRPRQKRAANADTKPETGARKHRVLEDDEPTGPEPTEDESDQAEDDAVESPSTAPEDTPHNVDQPSALERCVSDDEKLERVLVLWDQFVVPEWEQASEAVRLRFFEALGYSVVAANKAGKPDH